MGHEVTHSCGHTEQHAIYGTFAADVDRKARQLARRKCRSCHDVEKRAAAEVDRTLLGSIELPTLTGSARQVAWAETIRIGRLALLHRTDHGAMTAVVSVVDAKWWIDNRNLAPAQLIERISPQ